MKLYLCSVVVVAVLSLAATGKGDVLSIDSITLSGGSSDSVGRLNAEVKLADSVTQRTSVCNAVDYATAFFICQKLGYLLPTGVGTVSTISGVNDGSGIALISDVSCDGASSFSDCQFEAAVPPCSTSDFAAISCALTPGEVAGISVGVVLGCLLLFCLPIIICCCCCCGLCACITRRNKTPVSHEYAQM